MAKLICLTLAQAEFICDAWRARYDTPTFKQTAYTHAREGGFGVRGFKTGGASCAAMRWLTMKDLPALALEWNAGRLCKRGEG